MEVGQDLHGVVELHRDADTPEGELVVNGGGIGCVVRVAGEVVMTAAGAAVMGHPAASVAWLANQLAAEGEVLKAGQLVFSGGVTAPVPVVAGGSVTFQFGGLGSIEVAGA